jgi:hypothetical protein
MPAVGPASPIPSRIHSGPQSFGSGPIRRERRREEDEDQETREEEHRGGPRHDDGQAAEVCIHGTLTPIPGHVLRVRE